MRMALVTDISMPRRGSKRRVIELDHTEWRETSSEVLASLGVRAGHLAVEADLAEALDAAEPKQARERALRLLTYRERSAAEVRARLLEDGYPEAVGSGVVDALRRTGLVDDERFARMMARVLTQVRGMGRARALRELASKGVGAELAFASLDEALPPEAELEAAATLAHALAARPATTVDRIAARLVRKGYAPAIALRAAREAFATLERDASDDAGEWDGDGAADLPEEGV
jgi:regulatory protein